MKKIIMSFAIIFVLVSIVFCGYIESHYTREATVCKVENNIVTFTDPQGNFWEWEKEKEDDFIMGQKVKLHMSTNYTIDTIEDDIIEKVSKKD